MSTLGDSLRDFLNDSTFDLLIQITLQDKVVPAEAVSLPSSFDSTSFDSSPSLHLLNRIAAANMGDSSRHSFLSDGSSFYGGDDQKAKLEERAQAFDPAEWWADKPTTLMEVAARNKENQSFHKEAELYNVYEGIYSGRQLTETVDEFLKRLPPATTDISQLVPWIYISNPYIPLTRNQSDANHKHDKSEEEVNKDKDGEVKMGENSPLNEDDQEDISKFTILGNNLLSEFETERFMLRKEMQGKPTGKLDAAIAKSREEMVKRLKEYAVEYNCTSGKWLLFIDSLAVNEIWSLVAQRTATQELGIAAKVAPRNPERTDSRHQRLICVYTRDFNDMDDVTRVFRKLKDLGLYDAARPIYYKCDAYTYLGINSGNEWGIKASLYSSTELLGSKSKKLDSYFR